MHLEIVRYIESVTYQAPRIDESVDILFKQKPCCSTAIPVSYICLAFLATAKTIKSIVVLLISHEPYSDKHQKAIKSRANNF